MILALVTARHARGSRLSKGLLTLAGDSKRSQFSAVTIFGLRHQDAGSDNMIMMMMVLLLINLKRVAMPIREGQISSGSID